MSLFSCERHLARLNFLSLVFKCLTVMYLDVDFFVFTLFGMQFSSWMCKLLFFCHIWEVFSHYFSTLTALPSFSSSRTLIKQMSVLLSQSHRFLVPCHFFNSIFLLFILDNSIFYLPPSFTDSFFYPLRSAVDSVCWASFVFFYFSLLKISIWFLISYISLLSFIFF